MAGSRMKAIRVTPGTICLSSSSHFAAMLYSKLMNPVALPPGRGKLLTKPAPTGSGTFTNTIGTVRVACSRGPTVALPVVTITSGASVTNSATVLRMRSASPAAQRVSMRTLPPWVQPNCAQSLQESRVAGLTFRMVRGRGVQHTEPPHRARLLRARHERPCRRRAAEQREELAAPHDYCLRQPDHRPGPQAGRVPLTSRTIQISKHAPMKPAIR